MAQWAHAPPRVQPRSPSAPHSATLRRSTRSRGRLLRAVAAGSRGSRGWHGSAHASSSSAWNTSTSLDLAKRLRVVQRRRRRCERVRLRGGRDRLGDRRRVFRQAAERGGKASTFGREAAKRPDNHDQQRLHQPAGEDQDRAQAAPRRSDGNPPASTTATIDCSPTKDGGRAERDDQAAAKSPGRCRRNRRRGGRDRQGIRQKIETAIPSAANSMTAARLR